MCSFFNTYFVHMMNLKQKNTIQLSLLRNHIET